MLFVMNADGSAKKGLTETKGPNEFILAPSWSPDGKRIAFCTFVFGISGKGTPFSSPPHISLIDADGKNLKSLDQLGGINPAWSPDGKRLLFTRIAEGKSSLCSADADGTNVRALVELLGEGTVIFGAWSPDGKYLAYTVPDQGNGPPEATKQIKAGLFVAQSDGSQPRLLAGGSEQITLGVRWSSDSKQLFFTRRQMEKEVNKDKIFDKGPPTKTPALPSALGVYVVDLNGQNLRRLSPETQREYVGANYVFAMRLFLSGG